jgi:predicted cation transporter
VFVAALTFLGSGFTIVIDEYLSKVPGYALYWVNLSSGVLDNATLTAAEIAPSLSRAQIKDAILGLVIAGILLIPGNIPNIIAASKLRISMKEWARLGVPLGMAAMVVGFLAVVFF